MNEIAGSLTLLDAGRSVATLEDFELAENGVGVTLDVALPDALAHPTTGPVVFGDFRRDGDASLSTRWAAGCLVQARLDLPVPGLASTSVVRRGYRSEPTLYAPRSGNVTGTHWRQQLSFGPLPDDGELTFILASDMLHVRRAVAVVAVADLRSRIVDQR